jgi:hypothetical protein
LTHHRPKGWSGQGAPRHRSANRQQASRSRAHTGCCAPAPDITRSAATAVSTQLQALATLPASVQPTSALACPWPMPYSDFR